MGFCLLNNIAVAAAMLAERGERVLIVDWDVHHGNGTQAIFWDDPRVLYVSTHQWPLYPGTGRVTETGGPGAPGLTVNVPLPPRATGDVILAALDEVVAPVVEGFAPTWVLASAGYDAHRADPMAGLQPHLRGLRRHRQAGEGVRARHRPPGPAPRGWLRPRRPAPVGRSQRSPPLLDVEFRPEHASSGGPGDDAVEAARRAHHDDAGPLARRTPRLGPCARRDPRVL